MFKSIQTKLISFVFLIIAMTSIALTLISYFQTITQIEKLMGERAKSIAINGALLINGDHHQDVLRNLQKANELKKWHEMKDILKRVRKANGLKEDVYILADAYWIKKDKENPYGKVFFTATSLQEVFELKGQRKEEYINRAFKDQKPGYTNIFTTINGSFITGYAPILTKKGVVTGILEVALNTTKEIALTKNKIIGGFTKAFLVCLFIAAFLSLILASNVSRPIKLLVKSVKGLAEGNLKTRAPKTSARDEVAELSLGFNNMAQNLEKLYEKQKEYSENLEKKVQERTFELQAINRKIRAMIDNMELGVFSINESFHIDGPVSRFTTKIFNESLESQHILTTVFGSLKDNDPIKAAVKSSLLSVFGEDSMQWEVMEDNFPQKLEILVKEKEVLRKKYLKLSYNPIWDNEEKLTHILFVIDDQTEKRELEEKAKKVLEEKNKETVILASISDLEVDVAKEYFSKAKEMLDEILLQINASENLDSLFRDLHTLKGNSRLYKLSNVATTVHEVESELEKYKETQKLSDEEKKYFFR